MAADLAAVASRLEIDTRVALSPSREPVLDANDEESMACVCPDVEFMLGDNMSVGMGTLQLTTRRIVWVSRDASGPALALRYQQVVMHAISRDTSSFAKPCIYLQLDEGSEQMMEEGEEEEEQVSAEVRFVPADEAKVEDMFKALCDCAALNPDTDVEQDGEGDFFFDEAEVMAGVDPETRAAMVAARLEDGMDLGEGEEDGEGGEEDLQELVGDDPSRFQDDDEELEGGAAAGGHPTANGGV